MTIFTLRKQLLIGILLLLAGFILVGCNAADFLPETAVSNTTETSSQVDNSQTAVSNTWDAASFFATTCASCHGPTGSGSNIAPPLNTEAIQTADTEWIIETISYGRSGTAMPAWSVKFGGPLNSDQIADMAALIQSDALESVGDIATNPNQPTPGQGMGGGMMGNGMGGGMMGQGMGGGMMGQGQRP